MWQVHREPLAAGGERLTVMTGARAMTFADVLAGWQDDKGFRAFTIGMLAATSQPAVFWEMPPLRRSALGHPFECVLLPAPGLDSAEPDPAAFGGKFAAAPDDLVIMFENLGGDALLVVPCPQAPFAAYGHLLALLRRAPADQQHELFRMLGAAVARELETRPWLSTSGAGVPWLHVRLDRWPKYLQHRPYRET